MGFMSILLQLFGGSTPRGSTRESKQNSAALWMPDTGGVLAPAASVGARYCTRPPPPLPHPPVPATELHRQTTGCVLH